MALPTNRPAVGTFSALHARLSIARQIIGAIAAESTTRDVATFPVAQAFNCATYDTLLVTVEFGSGTGNVVLEPLFLDQDAGRWLQLLAGAPPGVALYANELVHTTLALDGTGLIEVPVHGKRVLFRVDSVGGGPLTDLNVLVTGGRTRFADFRK